MQPSEWGRIVESAIGAHLLNHSIKGNYNLYYWRYRNDEVDFVIEKKPGHSNRGKIKSFKKYKRHIRIQGEI